MHRSAALAIALLCAAWSGRAQAQLASPGDLSRVHAAIDGMSNCGKCHPGGKQLSAALCLDCHVELKRRVDAQRGYHGRLAGVEREACQKCHAEHEGKDGKLVVWKPSKEQFDHGRTGWPLKGKHVGPRCPTCHTPRLIGDAQVQAMLKKSPGFETYLGVSPQCTTCHFDEHRGQEGAGCESCHDEAAWKPVPRFSHDKTAYPLTGKHRPVACAKCHPTSKDADAHGDPKPRASTFLKLKGIEHGRCSECHDDPHDGQFGGDCEGCHSTADWKLIKKTANERKFHDKTEFPLKGAHARVACATCHGPFPGRPAKFKGLAHKRCMDCHADAHRGQLADPACERCHTVEAFRPATFEVEEHARTKYPLEGAHAAVACAACHPGDTKPAERKALPAVRPAGKGKGKGKGKAPVAAVGPPAQKVAAIVFRPAGATDRCETCHADYHAGQLKHLGAPCASCHAVASWKAFRFDHDKQARFPLTGAHQKTACVGCHPIEKIGGLETPRLRPIATACADCHEDVHRGQLRARARACDGCHRTEAWKALLFDHNDRRFTTYRLDGRHAKVACDRCHTLVKVGTAAKAREVRRYRPLPQACEACHADYHKGEFRGFEPTPVAAAPPGARGQVTRCAHCHAVAGWDQVRFEHDRTGFPLKGLHTKVSCKACHPSDFKRHVPMLCAGCHRDPHGAQFGQRCEGCHDENGWASRFNADAHRATNFPLTGRHAILPCSECHPQMRDRGFQRTPTACFACHKADYDRAAVGSIDHAAAGFPTDCRRCHETGSWRHARYPDHDRCFLFSRGPHAGLSCTQCHSSVPMGGVTGACMTGTATCTGCHAHTCAKTDAQHARLAVPGYECKEAKCQTCHPRGTR